MPARSRFTVSLNPQLSHYVAVASIGVTLLLGIYRHFIVDWSDPLHCRALLNQGQWLDNKFSNWQPEGCMLHSYSPADISKCLSSRRLVFIGDSTTRQLFFAMAHMADPDLPSRAPSDDGQKHADHTLTARNGSTLMSFIWDPFLNSSRTRDVLDWREEGGAAAASASASSPSLPAAVRKPAMLVVSTGLWFLRYADTSGGLERWEATVESTLESMGKAGGQLADATVFLPVEDAVHAKLSPERASTIRHSDVDAMNSDLMHRIDPPSSSPMTLQYASFSPSEIFSGGSPRGSAPEIAFPRAFNQMLDPSQTEDGLHFSDKISRAQANVLLNYRCNDVLPKDFPLDKTCCRKYPSPTFYQVLISLLAIAGFVAPWLSQRPRFRALLPGDHHIPALSAFSLAILLLFIADRTPIWSKEQKQYNPWVFGAWSILSLIAGLLSMKKAKDQNLGFLNREQTDEWKGWMQIAILIYHYFGASTISGIYNPIRVLVAAYLFMSGYGHTTYYIKKADYGLSRVAQVMVRLNMLPISLAYIMNTNYLSYYFSPLVSMWFLIIYATMAVGKSFNDRGLFLAIKFLLSMAIFTAIFTQEWILSDLFVLLERFCGIRWSAREWGFRVKLDLWIVYFGMFSALAYIKFRELRLIDDPRWPIVRRISILASCLILIWFFVFELTQPTKFVYNSWHPYISFLPIGAFVVLRNSSALLRSTSSRLFAFIGGCSLETFIIQFHFWMAADTKGVLLVIPGTNWRPVNMLISTVMFIWLSHKVAAATGELTNWFCGIQTTKTLPTSGPSRGVPADTSSHSETIPLADRGKDREPNGSRTLPDSSSDDRFANEASRPTPGYRMFVGDESSWWSKWSPWVGTRLIITGLVLWAINITWPS